MKNYVSAVENVKNEMNNDFKAILNAHNGGYNFATTNQFPFDTREEYEDFEDYDYIHDCVVDDRVEQDVYIALADKRNKMGVLGKVDAFVETLAFCNSALPVVHYTHPDTYDLIDDFVVLAAYVNQKDDIILYGYDYQKSDWFCIEPNDIKVNELQYLMGDIK